MSGGEDMELPDLRRAPAERLAAAVLPASPLIWTAAEIMHWAGRPGVAVTAMAAAALSGVTWGACARRGPSSLPAWTAIAGAWVTLADAVGPLHWWPAPYLTIAWAVIAFAASRAAHRHQAVVDAREWREAKADWLGRSHDWGLGGSHLLKFERTRLGELYTVSTKGTRKRASHFIGGHLEEVIAEAEDLAVNRVRVIGHGLAGRIMISVRRLDPWADVLLHPLVCEEPEVELPAARTIMRPIMVGQDPETGDVLEIPLCDLVGAKNVSITGMVGAGKGVLLDDISEGVTAADDALQIRINLSDKGWAEIESWGPSCHLTAFGPDQKKRAADVLKVVAGVIAWRARTYKRGQYKPSRRDPLIAVIVDESDEAAAVVRAGLDVIATKGREYGVAFVHVGQRGTADYSSAKQRSQDTIRCVGAVNRAGEARHAAGSMAHTIPDMATYGEAQPGVWAISKNGAGQRSGRSWVFSADPAEHAAEVEAIAQERAFAQPELPAACRAFLGETYEELLKTEVFARWARAQGYGDPEPEADDGTGESGDVTAVMPPSAPARWPAAADPAEDRTTLTEDPLQRLEMDMNDREREKLDRLAAKLGGARRVITEVRRRPAPPDVPAEALAAQVAEDWRQVGVEAVIPDAARPRLLEMLAAPPSAEDPRGGTTSTAVARAFGVSKWTARTWLEALRGEGVGYVDGVKKAARWRPAAPPPAGGEAGRGDPAAGDAP